MRSFGTGTHVKLPGSAPDRPNVYDFSTTYDEIYNDLWKKDRLTYPFVSLSLLFHSLFNEDSNNHIDRMLAGWHNIVLLNPTLVPFHIVCEYVSSFPAWSFKFFCVLDHKTRSYV